MAEVAAGGHRDDRAEGGASVGQGSEPSRGNVGWAGLSSVGPHLLLSAGLDHLASMASMAGKVTPSPRPSITRTWAGGDSK